MGRSSLKEGCKSMLYEVIQAERPTGIGDCIKFPKFIRAVIPTGAFHPFLQVHLQNIVCRFLNIIVGDVALTLYLLMFGCIL